MKVAACVVLLGLLARTTGWAQATAQIHGTVQDSSGSAVPAAQVKATQAETGASRVFTSLADGSYVLINLPLGPYRLEVAKEGFTKYVQSGIVLQVNSDPVIDPVLKVGSVTEQVVVVANATQVETRSSGIGEVVQTQRIVDLPLNGRNVTDLITLGGAAVNTGGTAQPYYNNLPKISIAGQAGSTTGGGYGTDYSLDGAMHTDYITGTTMPIPFPDAVQEFKVESSGQTAQRGSSASVSVVTRSGSNSFHGDAFEFIRNNGFGSAREYFSTNSGLKRNQFGGTIGGPVQRNKLFYFFGFQETTLRQNAGNSVSTVPTAAMLAGDWSTFASPKCQGKQITLHNSAGVAFGNNQIPTNSYSAPAMFIVNKLLPGLATDGIVPNQCGVVTYGTPTKENDYQYASKVDYQLTDKQSMFFRTLNTPLRIYNSQSQTTPATFNLLTLAVFGSSQLAHSYAFGHTYILSPNLVQSFRGSFERTSGFKTTPDITFDYCDAGVQIYCGYEPDAHWFQSLSMTGGFNLTSGGGGTPNGFTNTGFALNDDLSYIRGSHQMTFGVGAVRGQLYNLTANNSGGTFTFNGSLTGLGMSDFFLGLPSTFAQSRSTETENREYSFNVYFTDSWRITPRLTLNYGIRWEPFLPMSILNGRIASFDLNRFLQNVHSTVYVNAPAGYYFPGDPGFPGNSGTYSQWAHFDPRGGLAWDPKGDGKMSLRAGYAFGYAYVPGLTRLDQRNNNPWGGSTTVTNPQSFTNPFGNVPGGNPYPYQITSTIVFPQAGDSLTTPYHLTSPNTYSWNASLQRQFASWLVSTTYIGSRDMHLYVNLPTNYAQIVGPISSSCPATSSPATCSGTGNTQARRVLSLLNPSQGQYVGNQAIWDPSGVQTYHGLLTSAQKRFSHGVSASANWTWSHCITAGSGPANTTATTTVTVPGNPLFDKGNCDIDRRHIVNITAVALTPRFSNQWLRWTASDWQVAGIYRFSSGIPLNVLDGTDRELTGLSNQRPNLIGNPYTGQNGPSAQYLNPAAFVAQPLGTVGNLGFNSLHGPTYWDIDMALSRQFHITERQGLEIRADAFNLTNSFVSLMANSGNLVTITAGQFGQNISAQPVRQIQFAMKYTF